MKDTLTKKSSEYLALLGVESAELVQAIFNTQRCGLEARNQDDLIQRMGSILNMISIVCDELEIPWEVLEAAAKDNKEKIRKYK